MSNKFSLKGQMGFRGFSKTQEQMEKCIRLEKKTMYGTILQENVSKPNLSLDERTRSAR